jgi:TDG/mug DNA glycosylase family protein
MTSQRHTASRARSSPTRAELLAAADRTVADVLRPGLDIVFCGINPGLYTAAVGHHFARPGNRFWPALHAAGLTPRLFAPSEQALLLELGIGITNVARRASATADELSPEELVRGGRTLAAKVRRYQPRWLAVLGIGAYRAAFGKPRATLGRQEETIAATRIWLLPNPSGLNAHYSLAELGRLFGELRVATEG